MIFLWQLKFALISHRSAKEMHPTAIGNFFLTHSTTRRVTGLPGITLNYVKGPKASSHDIPFMGMQNEFAKINSIISALLSTHDAKVLSTDSAKALAAGRPFDPTRIELFKVLFEILLQNS